VQTKGVPVQEMPAPVNWKLTGAAAALPVMFHPFAYTPFAVGDATSVKAEDVPAL
jgi:hypothetical protein